VRLARRGAWRRRDGATAVEYVIGLALVALFVAAGARFLSSGMSARAQSVAFDINGSGAPAGGSTGSSGSTGSTGTGNGNGVGNGNGSASGNGNGNGKGGGKKGG
jgi:Flp pilus assembly pilin Flp